MPIDDSYCISLPLKTLIAIIREHINCLILLTQPDVSKLGEPAHYPAGGASTISKLTYDAVSDDERSSLIEINFDMFKLDLG
jgi:hypothetical protein